VSPRGASPERVQGRAVRRAANRAAGLQQPPGSTRACAGQAVTDMPRGARPRASARAPHHGRCFARCAPVLASARRCVRLAAPSTTAHSRGGRICPARGAHLVLDAAVDAVHLLQELVPLLHRGQARQQREPRQRLQREHVAREVIQLAADGVVEMEVDQLDGRAGVAGRAARARPLMHRGHRHGRRLAAQAAAPFLHLARLAAKCMMLRRQASAAAQSRFPHLCEHFMTDPD